MCDGYEYRDPYIPVGRGSSTAGGNTDWETTEDSAMDALLGGGAGGGRHSSRNSTASAGGEDSSVNTSTTGGGGGEGRDDESAGTADEVNEGWRQYYRVERVAALGVDPVSCLLVFPLCRWDGGIFPLRGRPSGFVGPSPRKMSDVWM